MSNHHSMPPHIKSRWIIFLLVGCFYVLPVQAQRSVPSLSGRVVDQADILSTTTERTLSSLLVAHEDATSNQVVVLTIPSLEGEVLEEYSLRVAETWRLGTAENDNGVLLLIAHTDRKIRIEVGYGLEGDLPDVAASRIINNVIVPEFRSGDFDGGVLAGTQAILGTIEGTYYPSDIAVAEGFDDIPWGFRLIFGGMFMGIPGIFLTLAVFTITGAMRWVMYFFLLPFFAIGSFVLTASGMGVLIVLMLYTLIFWGVPMIPRVRKVRERADKAFKSGKSAKIGPFTVSSSSSSGGWSSSSGSSWSSSGSSFSGGGGSFGGGGASGGW